jgi:sensor histidine kinase YesM
MGLPRIIEYLRMLEIRGDGWAAKRLSPEELAEAQELDRYLKRHWARLLAGYLGITLALSFLLTGIKPSLPVTETFVIANTLVIAVIISLVGVWFGHRRSARKPLWRLALTIVAITCAGAVVGALVGRTSKGETILSLGFAEIVRMVSVGLLTGLAVAFLIVGVTWIRGREARARQAALEAVAERERLEKRNREAELRLLQAQVEPHFLFNTLANLRHLVQKGSDDALPMLDHLIDYLRTALPGIREESSTVGREATLARAYLEIIRIRMGGDLSFEIDVPPALADHAVPPLMLMTLVENAVKHGIAPVGRGHVRLAASSADGRLTVLVEDDGRGLSGEAKPGVGLANVRERIATLFGDAATLDLRERAGGGVVAALTLPDIKPGST